MTERQPADSGTTRKLFTLEEANTTLPLVRAIITDITALSQDLRDRYERLKRYRTSGQRSSLSAAHQEELDQAESEFDKLKEQMREYETELEQLGVELKDYFLGLIDFPSMMNGRVVYLCWRLGEPEVTHWHELDAGFAGRKKLELKTGTSSGAGSSRAT